MTAIVTRIPARVGPGPGDYHLTDFGNAERLVALHGENLRYCHPWRSWLIWADCRWKRCTAQEIIRRAKETVRRMYLEAARLTEESRAALVKHALRSESNSRIRAMVEMTQSEPGIPIEPDQLDANGLLINCLNGTIELRTGEFRPHDPRDLITKLAPVDYNPDAECSRWMQFLEEIMNANQNLIQFLQRAVGYSLTGETSEQCLFLLHGSGANGKSTFLETIRSLLGDYAAQTNFSTFTHSDKNNNAIRNDLARLKGARVVCAVESESGKRFSESLIKQVTGQDMITARFLYQEYFEFHPEFKIFLAANSRPQIRGTDHAIWRRIKEIPFSVTIQEEQRDPFLLRRLREESQGIFNWALEGCRQWLENGLGIPGEVIAATNNYQEDQNPFTDFFADEGIQIDSDHVVPVSDLWERYNQYCRSTGERPLFRKKTTFREALRERGVEPRRSGRDGSWRIHGLGLPQSNPRGSRVDDQWAASL